MEFIWWRKNRKEPLTSVVDDWEEEQDEVWLDDLSNLESYEPYDWQSGEIGEGLPVRYIPGVGVVIVEE